MSSPSATPKKRVSETVSFIKATNPEIFKIQPRPGGVLHITADDFKTSIRSEEIPPESQQKLKSSLEEKISKEFRVQTALDETESIGSEDVTLPNPLKDAMYVFGVTISSLMLMAANHPNIPEDYLRWTTQCLENIKDDFGNHPPNVQGILNHLKNLNQGKSGGTEEKNTKNETRGDDNDEYEGEQTVKTSTKVHMGDRSKESVGRD